MTPRIDVDGEVDASYSSYWDKETHGQMSETISGTTKDDLHSEETITLPSEVDADDLTDLQERVIKTSVLHSDKSSYVIADMLDKDPAQVRGVLQKKCPEWYENIFKDGSSSTRLSPDIVRETIESNKRISRQELASELECHPTTIGNHLEKIDDLNIETGVGEYKAMEKVYSIGAPVESPSDESPSEPEEQATTTTEGRDTIGAVINAMKATAQYDETEQALEVVEGYL